MSQPLTRLQHPLNGIPEGVLCAQDYERLAAQFLAPPTLAYLAGGSAHDQTLRDNRIAFDHWAIWPRLLCNVATGHLTHELAGRTQAHPLMLAPVAFQRLAHERGELETARAAAATATPLVCSTLASQPLQAVADTLLAAGGQGWFQLYIQPQRSHTLALVQRAEAAGFEALVVTLDAAIQAPSLQALRAGFRMPADCVAVNLDGLVSPEPALPPGASRVLQGAMRHAPTWSDLDEVLAHTRLPVWVKGVMHPADAQALQARGVTGVIVSNHGGRTLDGVPASLAALPLVRQAVGPDFPVLFDSGVRSGADVFKALALGAQAVLVGRLQLYALSVAGALGVAHMLQLLREELEVCMAMAGTPTLADIGPSCLVARATPSTEWR